jgi:hypothetical protein
VRKLIAALFVLILLITVYAKCFYTNPVLHYTSNFNENFDARLWKINSYEKFEDTLALHIKNNYADTALVVNAIDDILRARFFHSYSEYTYNDNWIATLLGNYLWQDFKLIVDPYDLIKHPMAACSQQGLVFQKILSNHKIKYATVIFNNEDGKGGHYAVNAYYKSSWHYFDTNMEPHKLSGNPSLKTLLHDSLLVSIYSPKDKNWLESKIKNNQIHRVNENQQNGMRMLYFHKISAFMSNWLWLLLALAYVFFSTKIYTTLKATVLNKLTN